MSEQSSRIGHVISVAGSKVSALLVHANPTNPVESLDTSSGGHNGVLRSAVQVGAIARINTGYSTVFGMISISTGTISPAPSGAWSASRWVCLTV